MFCEDSLNIKTVTITFNIPSLLEQPHGEKSTHNTFVDYLIYDQSEYQEYENRYVELVKRAHAIVELTLYNLHSKSIDKKKSLYCYIPNHNIRDENIMLTQFSYYESDDNESESHFHVEDINEEIDHDTPYSINISRYFNSIKH